MNTISFKIFEISKLYITKLIKIIKLKQIKNKFLWLWCMDTSNKRFKIQNQTIQSGQLAIMERVKPANREGHYSGEENLLFKIGLNENPEMFLVYFLHTDILMSMRISVHAET